MIEPHLLKLRARHEIGAEDEQVIRSLLARTRDHAAGEVLVRAGERLEHSSLLLSGVVARLKGLKDGRQQITEIHVAGDFADLHSFTLKRLDHDIMALSDCQVALIPHERLKGLTEQNPYLTRVYWFATNMDAAIHREWELSLGLRDARARMAHLFCELHVRLGLVGLVTRDEFEVSLTQGQLAECLGLSAVHANRTIMQLRAEGLMDLRNGRVVISDLAGLREAAEFDPSYLYLERQPS